MSNVYNSPPPPPPPNVPSLDESTGTNAPHTVRERIEQHRKSPVCAACHAVIDPPGLALENFDPIGRWRDADQGQPIDPDTTLPGGIPVAGAAGLRDSLLKRPELFASTLTEKLMVYALGRRLEAGRPRGPRVVAAEGMLLGRRNVAIATIRQFDDHRSLERARGLDLQARHGVGLARRGGDGHVPDPQPLHHDLGRAVDDDDHAALGERRGLRTGAVPYAQPVTVGHQVGRQRQPHLKIGRAHV